MAFKDRVIEIAYELKDRFSKRTGKITGAMGRVEQEHDKTSKKIEQNNKRITRSFNSISTMASRMKLALVGMLATVSAVLTKSIKDNIDYADSLAKLEERIGVLPEKLSALDYVAKRANVEFNTLTLGLQRMTRRVSEAADGSGEAKDAIKELGLSAKELEALSPDEQFLRIAEALSLVENRGDRVRLAMRVFDSEGVKLLQTMTDGAQGIRDLMKEAEDLGVTVSSETAKKSAEFNDQLAELKATSEGLGRSIAEKAIPALNNFLKSVTTQINGPKTYIEEVRLQIQNLEADISRLEGRRSGFLSLFFDEEDTRRELKQVQERIANLSEHEKVLTQSAEEEERIMEDMRTARQKYREINVKEEEKETDAIKAELKEQQKAYKNHLTNIRKLKGKLASVNSEFADLVSQVQRGGDGKPADFIDVSKKKLDAQVALDRGNTEESLKLAREGGDMLLELQRNGEGASYAMEGLAKAFERIADQSVKTELIDVETATEETDAAIDVLEKMLGEGISAPLKIDTSQIQAELSGAIENARQLAAANPIVIPVQTAKVVGPGGSSSWSDAHMKKEALKRGEA